MNIHILQHVPFEGPAVIGDWIVSRGHDLSTTRFFEHNKLPALTSIDALVIMGGPMSVYDEDMHPWLRIEKQFIQDAIEKNKAVLGICLGAQLIAHVLGARVYQHHSKEIGWFPIQLTASGRSSTILGHLPAEMPVMHWHGETFELPDGAIHLARSTACENQAFVFNDRVLAFQFHMESTRNSVSSIAENCSHELVPGSFIQDFSTITGIANEVLNTTNQAMFGVLQNLIDNPKGKSEL